MLVLSIEPPREYAARLTTVLPQFMQLVEVASKNRIGLDAVLETLQIAIEFNRRPRRQRINHPVLVPLGLHQAPVTEVGEVLGNLHLRFIEDLLEVANAQGRSGEQMQNPQARLVRQTLINLDQMIHSF